MTINAEFLDKSYIVQRRAIAPAMAQFLTRQFQLIRQVDSLGQGDDQVPTSYSIHGALPFETLLDDLAPQLGALAGLPRYRPVPPISCPTLAHHRYRPYVKIALEPGDALVYRGCEVDHWRTKYDTGTWQAQVFLHYVDANGPNAAEKFDRRPYLGFKKPINRMVVQRGQLAGTE